VPHAILTRLERPDRSGREALFHLAISSTGDMKIEMVSILVATSWQQKQCN
jgi:hypothetical protein